MASVGIVVLAVGIFLVVGRFPSRTGWIVIALVAALPIAPAVAQGLASDEDVASVVSAAQTAYVAERGGSADAAADCTWEYDSEQTETWRCSITSGSGGDVCFVETSRVGERRTGRIDRCESDDSDVARSVERVYRTRGSGSASVEHCSGPDDAGLRRCDLQRARDRYCFVEARWQARREPEARISVCERELLRAVSDAYKRRSGR